jgi:hypothetical protein
LIGPNLKGVRAAVSTTEQSSAQIRYPGAPNAISIATVPCPVAIEAAPSDGKPQLLDVPVSVTGRISGPREEDVYRFTVKQNECYTIRVKSAAHRLPMDPVLTVKKPDGGLVKTVDDFDKTPDSEYVLKTTRQGDYTIHVRDARGWYGDDYMYRLDVMRSDVDYSAALDKDQYTVEAGSEAAVKIKFKRLYGHKAKLKLEAERLPAGASLEVPGLPDKTQDVTVKLKAAADAEPFSGPIRFQLSELDDADKVTETKELAYSFLDDKARGDYLVNETDAIWLTIKPKPVKKEDNK